MQGTLLELGHLITQAVEGDSTSSLRHWREVFMTESVLELGERCVNGEGSGCSGFSQEFLEARVCMCTLRVLLPMGGKVSVHKCLQ